MTDADKLISTVGQKVHELRLRRQITQEKLAELLGVSVQYVSRLESGENLTLRTMAKLAALFGVDVTDLFKPPTTVDAVSKRGRPRKK